MAHFFFLPAKMIMKTWKLKMLMLVVVMMTMMMIATMMMTMIICMVT